MKVNHRDWQVLSGLLALIILFLVTVIISMLRPEYHHLDQSFSDLGQLHAPYFLVFNILAFGLVGTLSIIFARVLWHSTSNSEINLPVKYHTLGGLCWILTGLFPLSDMVWLYWVHIGFAVLSYVLGGVTIFLYIRYFTRSEHQLDALILPSSLLLFGVWFGILLSNSVLSAQLGQLVSIGSYFLWQGVLSMYLYSKSG